MTVSSGVITWKPKDDQKGTYYVTVQVTDGKVATPATTTFKIAVEEAEDQGTDLGDMMIPLIIIIIIVVLIVALLAMGGKKKEPEEDEEEEVEEEVEEEEEGEEE